VHDAGGCCWQRFGTSNTLQHTVTYCNTLQCNTLQHTEVVASCETHYSTHSLTQCNTPTSRLAEILQHNTLQHTATHCNTPTSRIAEILQHNTLQHTATHCNTPTSRLAEILQHNTLQISLQHKRLQHTLSPCTATRLR